MLYIILVGATLALMSSCGRSPSNRELLEETQEDLEELRIQLQGYPPVEKEARNTYRSMQRNVSSAERHVGVLTRRQHKADLKVAAVKAAQEKKKTKPKEVKAPGDDRSFVDRVQFWKKAPEPEPTFTDRITFWRD